jgi:hypothetical protein
MVIAARRLYLVPRDEKNVERVEKDFFSSIRLRSGIYKTTWDGRMHETDAHFLSAIRGLNLPKTRFLDIGASSAVSTLNFLDFARQAGVELTAVATDLEIDAQIVSYSRFFHVLEDMHGHPLQFELCGIGLRPYFRRIDVLTGYVVLRWILMRNWARLRGRDRRIRSRAQVRLVSPRVLEKGIEVIEDNILRPPSAAMSGLYNAIRLMNVANPVYFSPGELEQIAKNTLGRLSNCGVVLVGRLDKQRVCRATLFKRSGENLEVLHRIGGGSEVEDFFVRIGSLA